MHREPHVNAYPTPMCAGNGSTDGMRHTRDNVGTGPHKEDAMTRTEIANKVYHAEAEQSPNFFRIST